MGVPGLSSPRLLAWVEELVHRRFLFVSLETISVSREPSNKSTHPRKGLNKPRNKTSRVG